MIVNSIFRTGLVYFSKLWKNVLKNPNIQYIHAYVNVANLVLDFILLHC